MSIAGNLGVSRVSVFTLSMRGDRFERAFALGTGGEFATESIEYIDSFVGWIARQDTPVHIDSFFTAKTEATLKECAWLEDIINAGFAQVSPLKRGEKVLGLVFYSGRIDGARLEGHSKHLLEILLRIGSAAMAAAFYHRSAFDSYEKRSRFFEIKEEIVTKSSFELNTPLTVLKSTLWSVESEAPGEGLMVDMAKDAVRNLEGRVSELANLSELRFEGTNLRIQKIDLSALIEDVLRDYIPEIEEKQIKVDYSEKVLTEIGADPAKMKISFAGIISRMIENLPRGGEIVISVSVNDAGPAELEGNELCAWQDSKSLNSASAVHQRDIVSSLLEDLEGSKEIFSAAGPQRWLVVRIKGESEEEGGFSSGDLSIPVRKSCRPDCSGDEIGGSSLPLARKIISDHGGRIFLREEGGVTGMTEFSIWLPAEI